MVKTIKVEAYGDENKGDAVIPAISVKGSRSSLQKEDHGKATINYITGLASKQSWDKLRSCLAKNPAQLNVVDKAGKSTLHHAAEKGQVEIMDMVLTQGGDINQQDKEGNTALHDAVGAGQLEAAKFLLDHKANVNAVNAKSCGPIHFAVEKDNGKMTALICKYKETNPELRAACGATPLHYACWQNSPEAAKALLEGGADIHVTCHSKIITPLHISAMQGSCEVMKVLLDHADKHLISKRSLMTVDIENSDPLHYAVSSGQVEAVKLCLQAGGDITSRQVDQSTAIHIACVEGSVEMVKVLLEMGALNIGFFNKDCVDIRDAMDMTPLHHTALYDHVELCQYLIEKGADINAQDNEERTPLILAAHKKANKVMSVLLARGADVDIKDTTSRNFIHAAVMSNCKLDNLGENNIEKYKDLLNDKDEKGCTPLHYASQLGLLNSMETLMNTGVLLNPRSNCKESPLHFAARYGRYNSCLKLLNSKIGSMMINETDGQYQSALHMAAENGHEKVVQLLMKKGAVMKLDTDSNSPLHLAAKNGYTRTIRTILNVHAHFLNTRTHDGNTAIHYASEAGHTNAVIMLLDERAEVLPNIKGETYLDIALRNKRTEVALATIRHERWEELFSTGSKIYCCYIMGFIRELPEICPIVYDRMITTSKDENGGTVTTYNFRHMQMNMVDMLQMRKRGEKIYPLPAANLMVENNRVELLNHPLLVQYLNMKWNAYGVQLFTLNLVIYALFLAALTYFVVNFPNWEHTDNLNAGNNSSTDDYFYKSFSYKFEFHCGYVISEIVVVVFCCVNIIKEIGQMIQQKLKYFTDVTNLLEWILYISCAIYIVPSLTMQMSCHLQWECGAIATFLAWLNLLLFFQRSGRFGIYVVMFIEILKTLVEVLIVFFVLIVAFGLSFYILLSNQVNMADGQGSVGMTLLRCTMMMLGDYDFKETFLYPYTDGDIHTMHYPNLTLILLVVFILLMPILLMNLLIGLAVGDIETIQRNAKLKRIAMQVELHTDLEKKLPGFLLIRADKDELVIRPCPMSHCTKAFSTLVGGGDGNLEFDEAAKKDSYVYDELFKQKQKMKEFSTTLDKTFDLVRLMVQKMEIKSEAEEMDEGFSPNEGWQAALNKHKLQVAVMSKIKR